MDENIDKVPIDMSVLCASLFENLKDNDVNVFTKNFIDSFMRSPSERYGDDFIFDLVRPAIIAIIRLRDDLNHELKYFQEFIEQNGHNLETTAYATEIFDTIMDGLNDLLLFYDVTAFRSDDDNLIFDPRRQSAVKIISTDDAHKVKTVADSLSYGYERHGHIVSKERVSVYSQSKAENKPVATSLNNSSMENLENSKEDF